MTTRLAGRIGWFEGRLVDVLDEQDLRVTRTPSGTFRVRYPAGSRSVRSFAGGPNPRGWLRSVGSTGAELARRYRDPAGVLWRLELRQDDGPLTCIATIRRGPPKQQARLRALCEACVSEDLFQEDVLDAVLREGPVSELAISFEYLAEKHDVILRNTEGPAWTGQWVIDRNSARGAVRGRLYRDGSDLFFLGEWEQVNVVYTCLMELSPGLLPPNPKRA